MSNIITIESSFVQLKMSSDAMSMDETTKIINEVIDQAQSQNLHIIIWRTNIVEPKGDILDVPYLIENFTNKNFSNKLAMVFPAAMETVGYDLLITRAVNQGIKIKSFNLIRKAMEWIEEK